MERYFVVLCRFCISIGVGGYLITIIVFIFYDQKEINDDDDELGLRVGLLRGRWVLVIVG